MRTRTTLLAALAATCLLHAGAAWAQQGNPPSAPGGGPRGPMGPRSGQDYTPGWNMMTPQERDAHHQRMQSARTADECRQVMDEHRKLMQERAKERGMGKLRGPRHDACANWGG